MFFIKIEIIRKENDIMNWNSARWLTNGSTKNTQKIF